MWFIVYIQSCLILYTFGVCYSLYFWSLLFFTFSAVLVVYTFGVCYSLYFWSLLFFILSGVWVVYANCWCWLGVATAAAGEVYSGRCNFALKCQLAKLYQPLPFRGLPYGGGSVIVSKANLENQITDRAVPEASRAMGRAGLLSRRSVILYFTGLP